MRKLSNLKSIRSFSILILGGLTIALFQNCDLGAMTSPSKDVDISSVSPGVLGISPTSVQLAWTGVATASSYQIYDLNRGNQPIFPTVFTVASLKDLTANTQYTFSVRGLRGESQYLTDSLATYAVKTWPLFTDVSFATRVDADSSQVITWTYAPWNNGLDATPNSRRSSNIACSFLPVPSGTDPSTIDPTLAANGVSPIVVNGFLFEQSLAVPLGTVDSHLTYATQCSAQFVDGTTSASKMKFLLNPTHLVTSCDPSAQVGKSYSCSPNVHEPAGQAALGAFTIALDSANTCSWATVAGTAIQSNGDLGAADKGSCNLVYHYEIPGISYTSPSIIQKITISVPALFQTFPSFAVRALSGAVAFPHLYSTLTGQTDTRAFIRADLISDFGYGNTFFAGGDTPFPIFNPTAPTLTSTFFYGFPVSTIVGGVRPNGYSLDAIRKTWQSTSPSTEGFLRGNLVIPSVSINNATFLAKTGSSAPPKLYDFLTNVFTFDGGSNFTPAPLAYALHTISDRDAVGSPQTSLWDGSVYERPSITFKLPTSQTLKSFVPASGINGQTTFVSNTDPKKAVTGLIAAPATNSIYYATNCQASPLTYPNSSACTPPGSAPIPFSIACYGDIIVQAPVLLVNPVFSTDDGGCRIYATGSVFIQGSITAYNTDGTTNATVQILSSRAVVFGFSERSLGVAVGGARTSGQGGILDTAIAGGTLNPYLTSSANGPGAAASALNSIASDADIVGMKADDNAGGALAAGNQSYSRVVVAAPYVFSNYSGLFKGSLIAEIAAFTHLNFEADANLLTTTTPFPLLTNDLVPLKVSAP